MSALTPEEVLSAPLAPAGKTINLRDGNGLFLRIDSNAKGWRYRYTLAGKDCLISLGPYPRVSLDEARAKAQKAREQLKRGENPSATRQHERTQAATAAAKTFGVVAAEFNAKAATKGLSAKTLERCRRMFNHSRRLHGRQFAEITRPHLLALCRMLEADGKIESAHRMGIYVAQVFRFARDEGYYAGSDPTIGGFGKSLSPVRETHREALTDPVQVGALMRVIDSAISWSAELQPNLRPGSYAHGLLGPTVARALQLLARTAVRPGELRMAEWSEFDLDGSKPRHAGQPTWLIPLSRMKMQDGNRTDHVVPLSRQAVAILKAQHELTGHGRYVFPNARSDARPMSDGALPAAMVGMGYGGQHVPHGFRAMFKSLAQDMLHAESELVERQLAHKVGSTVAAAYDRSQRLKERRALMQQYSDLLDKLRD